LAVPRLGRRIVGGRSVLIYQTDDSDFAESAVQALKEEGIDAYATGGALPGGSGPTVRIYIRGSAAIRTANAVLIKLGAATEEPGVAPKWVFAVLAMAAVILAIALLVTSKG
jgi:hypothetical protein